MNAAELRVWAVAKGDDEVIVVSALCREHARDTSDSLPIGFHLFEVKARAWVRRVLGGEARCSECAVRTGAVMRVFGVGSVGRVKTADLTVAGGEA